MSPNNSGVYCLGIDYCPIVPIGSFPSVVDFPLFFITKSLFDVINPSFVSTVPLFNFTVSLILLFHSFHLLFYYEKYAIGLVLLARSR